MTMRIRYIRPDFFDDEDVAELPEKAQLFFIGLWTRADRAGRLEDRPKRLRVQLRPYDDGFDAEEALAVLARPKKTSGRPFILRYEVNGERYIQILSWDRHQRPHQTEKKSEIPPPPNNASLTVKERLQNNGDGDCDGNGNGDWNGEGDRGRGKPQTEETTPPVPSRGSGQIPPATPPDLTTLPIEKRVINGKPSGEKEFKTLVDGLTKKLGRDR